MRIDDEKLIAYADGELGPEERAAVERALEADPLLRDQLAAQQRLRSALAGHYGPVASEDVPDRLLAMLGAERPEETAVASLSDARERRRRSSAPAWPQLGAMAAALALGLIAGQQMSMRGAGPIAVEDGMLTARGRLASALETQLASAQAPDAPVRIGITFADRQGRYCRSFEGAEASGLACRDGGDWRLVMTGPGKAAGAAEYRQAGSAFVLEAAQDLAAGAPLDPEAERAAVASGWKISSPERD